MTSAEDKARVSARRLHSVAASIRIATLPLPLAQNKKDPDDCRDVLRQKDGDVLLRKAIDDAVVWAPAADGRRQPRNNALRSNRSCKRSTHRGGARRKPSLGASRGRVWLNWDGKRWKEDKLLRTESLAKLTLKKLFAEAAKHIERGDGERAKHAIRFAEKSNAANGIKHALELARSEDGISIVPAQLNTNNWLLNVENGVLDLRTGELRPHDRADLISNLAPVVFNADADAPTWERFILDTFPDGEVRKFVQRCVGMSLVGETRDHVFLFCYGTGANGKSTLLNVINKLMGDYGFSGTGRNDDRKQT